MKNFIFVITAGLFVGVGVGFNIGFTPTLANILASVVSIVIVGGIIVVYRRYVVVLYVGLFLVSFFIGVLVTATKPSINKTIFTFNNERNNIVGTVVSDIEHRESTDRYVVIVTKLNGMQQEIQQKIVVYEPYPSNCLFDSRFEAKGIIKRPEPFITPTGRVFPYDKHLIKDNIYGIVFLNQQQAPICTGSETGKRHLYGKVFSRARMFTVLKLERYLPEPESSLLGGLLLGLRGSLTTELLEAFRISGLIHIIVLSGYNVMIVAEAVRRVFARLPQKYNLCIAMITIILFVLLAGAQTAAVRAGIMATIGLIALLMHRENDGLRALALAGCLMVVYNPVQLLYDVSFHLSFLATAGLLLYTPIFNRLLRFIPESFQLRNITAITLSVQLFLIPYFSYRIGEVSLVGILANMLVLPIVPIAMCFGFLIVVVGTFIPLGAHILAPLAYLPAHTITTLATILAVPEYASVTLPEISLLVMFFLYILMVILALKWNKNI